MFRLLCILFFLVALPVTAQDSSLTLLHRLGAGGFNDVKYLSDGKTVVVSTRIGVSLIEVNAPHSYPPMLNAPREFYASALAVNPDGSLIAAGGTDFGIYLWRGDESFLTELRAHEGELTALAFSPDSAYLVSAAADSTLVIWDTTTFAEVARITNLTAPANQVLFSPDGATLIASQRDGVIQFYDATTFENTGGFTIEGSPRRLALSPDGTLLAGANSRSSNFWIWDIEAADYLVQHSPAQPVDMSDVAFSPDGATLYALPISRELLTVAVPDTTMAAIPLAIVNEQRLAIDISPDGTQAVLITTNGLSVIDLATGAETARVNSPNIIYDVAFNPSGMSIAAAKSDGSIDFWSPDGSLNATLETPTEAWIEQVDYLPDNTLITLDLQNNFTVGDIPAQKVVDGFSNFRLMETSAFAVTLTLGANAQSVRIFDSTRTQIGELTDFGAPVTALAISENGQYAAVGVQGKGVYLHDLMAAQQVGFFAITQGNAAALAFSPDSALIAVGRDSGIVTVYQLDGTPLEAFTQAQIFGAIRDITYSPDGLLIAAVGTDNQVHVWDSADGTPLLTSPTLTANLTSLDFSPDGLLIATSGADGIVRLWAVE